MIERDLRQSADDCSVTGGHVSHRGVRIKTKLFQLCESGCVLVARCLMGLRHDARSSIVQSINSADATNVDPAPSGIVTLSTSWPMSAFTTMGNLSLRSRTSSKK